VTAFLARRVLQAVAVLVLVTLIVFVLLQLGPGSARAGVVGAGNAHSQFLLQYLSWLGQVASGNLGTSPAGSVSTVLANSFPQTLVLMSVSTAIALLVAIPVGMAQAIRRNTATDAVLRVITYAFYGMPAFVLGSLLILFLAVDQHIFGAEGPQTPGFAGTIGDWRDLTLPVATLSLGTIAVFARYLRSSASDSLDQDYVEAARARGAGEGRVLTRHVLRNSLIPLVTLVGLSLPQILGGALIVESLFNIRGVGWQIWQAATNHDIPVILGFTLVIGVGAVVGSLLADIGYAILDPRVRYSPR
jgi:peptide/nickel transport system permease protein